MLRPRRRLKVCCAVDCAGAGLVVRLTPVPSVPPPPEGPSITEWGRGVKREWGINKYVCQACDSDDLADRPRGRGALSCECGVARPYVKAQPVDVKQSILHAWHRTPEDSRFSLPHETGRKHRLSALRPALSPCGNTIANPDTAVGQETNRNKATLARSRDLEETNLPLKADHVPSPILLPGVNLLITENSLFTALAQQHVLARRAKMNFFKNERTVDWASVAV